VINSSALNAVESTSDDTLDAEAGALWGDVAKAALARGRLPPVTPDAMMLSVGGTLSVGGMGETGFRCGAQVDHVLALDVVTGAEGHHTKLSTAQRLDNAQSIATYRAGRTE